MSRGATMSERAALGDEADGSGMRRALPGAALVLGLVLAIIAAACGPAPRARGEGDGQPVRVITLWHAYSADERAALDEVASRFNASHPGIRLELVSVPYDAFPDKITAAIPNGNGPDLFIFAHDRVGHWAEAGLLEPVEFWVDEALADRFDLQAVNAMAYRGALYGLPLAVKSLALYWRTDLVDRPPATTDELLAMGHRFTDRDAGRFGLAYENSKLYGHAAWLHGFGGAVFDEDGRPTLATPEGRAALELARTIGGPGGIVPTEATGTLVSTLFNEGRAPLAMSGPWFVGGIAEGTAWAVAPLPVVSATGRPAAPFLGAEGVMMSARSRDKRDAFVVMDYLTDDASAVLRARRARQVVPNRAAYADPEIKKDKVLAAFRAQAEVAVPMPATPAMQMVWTPYDTAIQKVLGQGADPAAALADAQREVEGYMKGAER